MGTFRRRAFRANLQDLAKYLRDVHVDVEVPDSRGILRKSLTAQERDVIKVVASVGSLGLRLNAQYAADHESELRPITRWTGSGPDLPVFDANQLLSQFSEGETDSQVQLLALEDYCRYLLSAGDIRDFSYVLRRLRSYQKPELIERLLGTRGPRGTAISGRIRWDELVRMVTRCGDYSAVARFVAATVGQAPDEPRREMMRHLALSIRDFGVDGEHPTMLGPALHVLWQNRQRLLDKEREQLLDEVRRSLNQSRLKACFLNGGSISSRRGLLATLLKLFSGDVSLLIRLGVVEESLFETRQKTNTREIRAAIRIVLDLAQSTNNTVGAVWLKMKFGALVDIAEQKPGIGWSIDNGLALLALRHLLQYEDMDPENIADSILASSQSWNVRQFVAGMSAIEDCSNSVVRQTLRIAFRTGFDGVLRSRLMRSDLASSATLIWYVRRFAPVQVHGMLYPAGRQIDSQLAEAFAREIHGTADAKGTSRLLRALISVDEEFDGVQPTFAAEVVRLIANRGLLLAMLRDPRVSVVTYLVEALVAGESEFVSEFLDDLLTTVVDSVNARGVERPWAARLALSLIEAEESGLLKSEKSIYERLGSAIDLARISDWMKIGAHHQVLQFYHQLAAVVRPEAVESFAKYYGKASAGINCQFCQLRESDEPDEVLMVAAVISKSLYLGGHANPVKVTDTLREHWNTHGRSGKAIRLSRNPGRAAATIDLLAILDPTLLDGIPDKYLIFCIEHAGPFVAARMLRGIARINRMRALRLFQELRDNGSWSVLIDTVTDEDNPRTRAIVVRMLHRAVGEPRPTSIPQVLHKVKDEFGGTTSVPVASELLWLLSQWETDFGQVVGVARKKDWNFLPSSVGRISRRDLAHIGTLAGLLSSAGYPEASRGLLAASISGDISRRLDLLGAARFLAVVDRVAYGTDCYDLADELGERLRAALLQKSFRDQHDHLASIGYAARECARFDAKVAWPEVVPALSGRPRCALALWSVGWLDRSGAAHDKQVIGFIREARAGDGGGR